MASKKARHSKSPANKGFRKRSDKTRTDVILPMTDDCMQQIISQAKNYEYRRYRIDTSVLRVWFYLSAPYSHIAYICEIDPARTRNPGDEPLVEDGLGNKEFNERHKDWEGCDFAYRIRSVWKLKQPIGLQRMKTVFGVKAAPRGLIYVPATIIAHVQWNEQEIVWSTLNEAIPTVQTQPSMTAVPAVANNAKRTRGLLEEEGDQPSGKRTRLSYQNKEVSISGELS